MIPLTPEAQKYHDEVFLPKCMRALGLFSVIAGSRKKRRVKSPIHTKTRVKAKVTAALTGTKAEGQKTVFRIPNIPNAELLIAQMRKYLNKDDYQIRVRFRGPREKLAYHTKKKNAEWFAIYIDKK